MKVNVNDNRINADYLCDVYTYSLEEKETILTFDYQEQVWTVWTSVPSHITKLLKLKDNNFKVESVTDTGRITSIRGILKPKQISFRNIIELSEERREEIRNRFAK